LLLIKDKDDANTCFKDYSIEGKCCVFSKGGISEAENW
jgi:hypothetical protein